MILIDFDGLNINDFLASPGNHLGFAYQSCQELVPVDHVDNAVSLVGYLEYKMSSLHMKYLGLPLEAIFKANVFRDEVIAKIEYRLDG